MNCIIGVENVNGWKEKCSPGSGRRECAKSPPKPAGNTPPWPGLGPCLIFNAKI
jgi:hypothetical protein